MAVLPGKRVRDNSIFGTISSNMSAVTTTLSSLDLVDLSAISGDHAIITLDPFRQAGDPEIVMVTTHTGGSTSATIQRGMYGTTARAHNAGTQWAHAATVEDYADVVTSGTLPADQYEGQLVYQTDTDSYRYFDGVTWRTLGAGSAITLAYAENIALSQGVTALVPVTGLSVTFTVPAGRRIRVAAHAAVQNTADQNRTNFDIYEGATRLQFGAIVHAAANINDSIETSVVLSPTAGTHTYFVQAASSAGTSTVSGAATSPAFILVEDITGTEGPFVGGSVPVGQIGYSQTTANSAAVGIGGSVDLLSVNVVVPAGRVLRITGHGRPNHAAANAVVRLTIDEGATQLNYWENTLATAGNGYTEGPSVVVSPGAGSHTYTLRLKNLTVGNAQNNAAVDNPTYLLVEDITPTPTASSGAPSSTLGYAQVTADQAGITALTDLNGLSVTVTVPAGRRLRVSSHMELDSSTSTDVIYSRIMEGAATLQFGVVSAAASQISDPKVIISPAAGTHTYKLAAERASGSGSITMFAGPEYPAFILVEDITGSVWPAGSQVTSGIIASEAWTSWSPIITQAVNVTYTNIDSKYMKIGRTVHLKMKVQIVGAGTAANIISITGLPSAASIAQFQTIGTANIFDASAGQDFAGITRFQGSATQIYFLTTTYPGGGLGASGFTAGLAATDQIEFMATYESAS